MLCALNCVCEVQLPTNTHFNPQYKLLFTVIYNIAIIRVNRSDEPTVTRKP